MLRALLVLTVLVSGLFGRYQIILAYSTAPIINVMRWYDPYNSDMIILCFRLDIFVVLRADPRPQIKSKMDQ